MTVLRDIEAIDDLLVDGTTKGMPPLLAPTRLGEVGRQGWNLLRDSVPFPAAVIRQEVLRANSRWMRRFLELTGVSLCPHAKTTMAPQLFDLQLRDGAWGLTAATVNHVALYRRFGVSRIILANQLLHPQGLAYIARQLRDDPTFDFYCLVDSLAGLHWLVDALRRYEIGRPLQVLLEVGLPGGRTGLRTARGAVDLARAIAGASPWVTLRGIEAFEGVLDVTSAEGRQRIERQLDAFAETALSCDRERLFGAGDVLLTAGGSAYFDEVTRRLTALPLGRPVRVVLRSGCYLTHDVGFYGPAHELMAGRSAVIASMGERLSAALEVWVQVQSRPEPDLAILTAGKRDVSYDVSFPVPTRVYRPGSDSRPRPASAIGTVFALNDQHAFLRVGPGAELAVGDLLALGVAHPCTTFDKWQVLLLVDEDYNVTGAVKTFF